MRIELDIDDELVRRVRHLTGEASVSDAIREAFGEYARTETAGRFEKLRGRIQFDPAYLAEREREHPGTISPELLNSDQN